MFHNARYNISRHASLRQVVIVTVA